MSQEIRSYEGTEPYIFISYAHRDSVRAIPIMQKLVDEGFRIWYDEGIAPGSEWTENIAEHLRRAEVVLAFGSKSYVSSKNCRQEIEFSISEEKNLLVIWLEETELSAGLKMRVSTIQNIKKYQLDEGAFYRKLYQTTSIMKTRWSIPETPPIQEQLQGQVPPGIQYQGQEMVQLSSQNQKEAGGNQIQKQSKTGNRKKKFPLIPVLIASAVLIVGIVGGILLFGGKSKTSSSSGQSDSDEVMITIAGKSYKSSSRTLSINDCTLSEEDKKAIGRLNKLYVLRLENCGLDSLSGIPFENLKELVSISLQGNPGITSEDLAALSAIKSQITQLNLAGTGVDNLEKILPAEKLSILSLDGCTGFSNDEQLSKLTNLEGLFISNTEISSVESFTELTKLKRFSAEGNHLKSLKGLENALYLEEVYAGDNLLTTMDGLENTTQLINVDLHGNSISDVSVLKKSVKTLKILDLSGNPISDTESFYSEIALPAENASAFFLDDTGLDKLSSFNNMSGLKYLSLKNNKIAEGDVSLVLRKLVYLDVSGNQLKGSFDLFSEESSYSVAIMDNQLTGIRVNGSLSRVFLSGNPIVQLGAEGASAFEVYLSYRDNMKGSVGTSGSVYMEDVPMDLRVNMEKQDYRIKFVERADTETAYDKLRNEKYEKVMLKKTEYF